MEIPIANIYYLLCYAWEALEEKDTLADVGALDSTDLLGLFARVLTNGTRRLLRRGLDRGYLPREGEIAGVRGKLLTRNRIPNKRYITRISKLPNRRFCNQKICY